MVSATGVVLEENAIADAATDGIPGDLESISSQFATLSVDLIARDVEEEGLYQRVERAEKELREWRRVNGMQGRVKRWPREDAVRNFEEWSREGHPARRIATPPNASATAERRDTVEEIEEIEKVEMEEEHYEQEYEFEML